MDIFMKAFVPGVRVMHVFVRELADQDIAGLLVMSRLADGADTVAVNVDTVRRSLSENLSEKIYVAQMDSNLVGFATVYIVRSFCYARPTAEITHLFVRQELRRRGIATALIRKIMQHCVQLHVLEIFLRVNQENDCAIACYEKNGLKRANHFEYRIKYY